MGQESRVTDFVSEDDLDTFEGWLKYQGFPNPSQLSDVEVANWRAVFDESQKRSLVAPKVGLMKLPLIPGEFRYAVAIRDQGKLWLALWVRRSLKGEYFILIPRGERNWDPHTSYHLDGTVHSKSFGRKFPRGSKRQPLTNGFSGTAHLGAYLGFGPKGVGAICDPAAFAGVIEVGPDVLGPRHGVVLVDLVAPGCDPTNSGYKIIDQGTFKDAVPWVVLTVGSEPSE